VVTDADKVRFKQAFNVLAVATRLPADQADAPMQRIYFQGMLDLTIESVIASAETLAMSAEWFPKLAEWRGAAKIAHVATLTALSEDREQPWEDECGACLDTGWEERWCYPGTANNCGRRKCVKGQDRKEHKYGTPCSCRATNRTYARHHVAGNRADYSERM
jgi:hypothetical protein